MPHLRLVHGRAPHDVPSVPEESADDRPHVSLRLLMAASGRCSCDDCLWAYRRGDKSAGIMRVGCGSPLLTAVQ
jgi:hypothetical protein